MRSGSHDSEHVEQIASHLGHTQTHKHTWTIIPPTWPTTTPIQIHKHVNHSPRTWGCTSVSLSNLERMTLGGAHECQQPHVSVNAAALNMQKTQMPNTRRRRWSVMDVLRRGALTGSRSLCLSLGASLGVSHSRSVNLSLSASFFSTGT